MIPAIINEEPVLQAEVAIAHSSSNDDFVYRPSSYQEHESISSSGTDTQHTDGSVPSSDPPPASMPNLGGLIPNEPSSAVLHHKHSASATDFHFRLHERNSANFASAKSAPEERVAARAISHRLAASAEDLHYSDAAGSSTLSDLHSSGARSSAASSSFTASFGASSLPSTEDGIRALEEEADNYDVYQFLVQLDCYRANPDVLQRGFQLLRLLVVEIHRRKPRTRYCFPQDTWCKTIKSAMTEHAHHRDMQNEAVSTILSLSYISNGYKTDLLSHNVAREIVTAMEIHRGIEANCCAALESLTRTEHVGASWIDEHLHETIKSLVSVLSDPSRSGKDWAILALYNISQQDGLLPELLEEIFIFVSESRVMEAFIDVMQEEAATEQVLEAAMFLLWHWSVSSMSDGAESSPISSCEELVSAVTGAIYTFESERLHEAACGLLSSIQIPSSSNTEGASIAWKQTLTDAVWSSLTKHTSVEVVQIAGLDALCSIFHQHSEQEDSVAELDRIVDAVVLAMENFPSNGAVQARGCLALAYICMHGPTFKMIVANREGITAISNAFHSHVVNIDQVAKPPPHSEDVKVGVCSALASLATNIDTLPLLRQSDLLLHFQTVVERDELPPGPSGVRTCLINLIASYVLESESAEPSELNANSEPDFLYLTPLATKLMLESSIEEEVSVLIAFLHFMSYRFPSVLDTMMAAESGTGIGHLIDQLEKFSDNAVIQENGCGILANIYFGIPFEGQLNQSSEISLSTGTLNVQTHTIREAEVMKSALVQHRTNAGVVKNACRGLCDFISGLAVMSLGSEDVLVSEDTALIFSEVPKEVDRVMAIHEDNLEVQKSALRLAQVATFIIGEDVLQLCSANLIARIYETMVRFPEEPEIHETACIILTKFVAVENEAIDGSVSNADGLRALLCSLHMENGVIVSYATSIISSLLRRVFTLSNDILDIQDYLGCLIDCICKFPDSVSIQTAVCSILTSLATLSDEFVKAVIASHGGVNAIMMVMVSHRGDAYVQEFAIRALSAIAEGISDTAMDLVRDTVCEELTLALASYNNAEGVRCATLEALCEFCVRGDEYFKDCVAQSNAIPWIVEVMRQHLTSVEVQKAGCNLLWILAWKNDENKLEIGQMGGILAIRMALLAHIDSTAVQKEALTALKHVSGISRNKEVLRRHDLDDAVRLSIWANYEAPDVICAALSALNDMAVDTSSREVAPLKDEILQCVIRSMKTHPSVNEIQKVACWLLSSYTYNQNNLNLMRGRRGELTQLLLRAAYSYPEECGERAQFVFERLC